MLDWIKGLGSRTNHRREPVETAPKPKGRAMTGQYLLLYEYLENRYANTVVLTFSEIEDLLGFTLPDHARLHQAWWTGAHGAGPDYSDSWVLARRTAVPNMIARTVVFERTA